MGILRLKKDAHWIQNLKNDAHWTLQKDAHWTPLPNMLKQTSLERQSLTEFCCERHAQQVSCFLDMLLVKSQNWVAGGQLSDIWRRTHLTSQGLVPNAVPNLCSYGVYSHIPY